MTDIESRLRVNLSGKWVFRVVEDEDGRSMIVELQDSAGRVLAVRAPTNEEIKEITSDD